MAAGNLSPRQKMINMMYLVLTALLALNVSKEVLNSFFEVNNGIVRTTNNFNLKNIESYSDFDNAVANNPEKFTDVRNQAFSVKNQADAIIEYIQAMKYDLVYYADGNKVALGMASDILGDDGKPIKEKLTVDTKWNQLTAQQKKLPIVYLNNKKDRDKAGNLFFPKTPIKEKRASVLKNKIQIYRDSLVLLAGSNEFLANKIKEVCDVTSKSKKGKEIPWEEYNFVDMPAVGALTILSKIQSDLRNIESDVINYLKRNIDAKSLKFSSAEGIAIPTSNFVLRGDSFRAEIFISAKNEDQNPAVYVGEYDSLGNGEYKMVGDYETVKVRNGKGFYSKRASTEGDKKWGGLIEMKTETGTKYYPFSGEYLVAAKTAVVSPTNMNVLYLEVNNPLEISVPGKPASEISAVINNGQVKPFKKSLGQYTARPSKKGKAVVTLYANIDGKRTKMGSKEFRVKEVPPPKAEVKYSTVVNGETFIDKSKMVTAGGISAKLKDFDFKGINYVVTSFKLTGMIKGEQATELTKGPAFSKQMINIIKNTRSGNTITLSAIKARRTDAKNTALRSLDPVVIQIK